MAKGDADLLRASVSLLLKGHKLQVSDLAVSNDTNALVSASHDGSLRIWNLKKGKQLFSFQIGFGVLDISRIALHPSGKWIATGEFNWDIKIWNVAKEKLVQTVKYKSRDIGRIGSVQFTPDDQYLLSADHFVKLWRVRMGKKIISLHKTLGPGLFACMSADGKLIASCNGLSRDPITIWDVTQTRIVASIPIVTLGFVKDIQLSPKGKYVFLFLRSPDAVYARIYVWDLPKKLVKK